MAITVDFSQNYQSPIKEAYDTSEQTPAASVDKIYLDASDKFVASKVIYMNSDGDLFYTYDPSATSEYVYTNEVPVADYEGLFMSGVVCLFSGTYYAATACKPGTSLTFAVPSESEDNGET